MKEWLIICMLVIGTINISVSAQQMEMKTSSEYELGNVQSPSLQTGNTVFTNQNSQLRSGPFTPPPPPTEPTTVGGAPVRDANLVILLLAIGYGLTKRRKLKS